MEHNIVIDDPVQNDKKISVASFGAKPGKKYCSGKAFQDAIDYCKQEQISELTVPKGVYYFTSGIHPTFDGCNDFIFNGEGSEFVFSTVSNFFTIKNCNRMIIKNFTVDWDWEVGQLASIGLVQSVASDNSSFELYFPEYEWLPDSLLIQTLNAMNPRTLTPGCDNGYEFSRAQLGSIERKNDNSLQIETLNSDFFSFLKQGQTYIVRHYIYDANAFQLHNNQHMRIANVVIYSAPGSGFVSTGDQHYWTIEHCRIMKRPGTTRCISVTADGCHVSNSKGYFIMENCDFSYNGDDCLNIHDNSIQGFERLNENTLRLNSAISWRNPFSEGDPVEFRHTDLSPSGVIANVKTVEWDSDNNHCTLSFDRSIPARLSDRSILFNRRYNSDHYIVRNNVFHQNRARGVLLHSGNGLVENNHFYLNQGSAIQIECGAESRWAEGFGVDGLVIRNNVIESSDVNHWNMAVIYMGVYLEQGRTQYPIFRNIVIENNTIVHCPQQAIYISSCERASIRNNCFLNTNAGHLKTDKDGDGNCVSNRNYYQGSLMVSHSSDIVIENNRNLAMIPTKENHIYVHPSTTSEVTVHYNEGFESR